MFAPFAPGSRQAEVGKATRLNNAVWTTPDVSTSFGTVSVICADVAVLNREVLKNRLLVVRSKGVSGQSGTLTEKQTSHSREVTIWT